MLTPLDPPRKEKISEKEEEEEGEESPSHLNTIWDEEEFGVTMMMISWKKHVLLMTITFEVREF